MVAGRRSGLPPASAVSSLSRGVIFFLSRPTVYASGQNRVQAGVVLTVSVFRSSPPRGEELLQQFHALGRQHTFHYFDAVVEEVGIRQAELAAHAAEAQVARAEDQA